MSFWLPETMGKPMTQTIEEAESSYYSDKQKGDYVLGMFSLFWFVDKSDHLIFGTNQKLKKLKQYLNCDEVIPLLLELYQIIRLCSFHPVKPNKPQTQGVLILQIGFVRDGPLNSKGHIEW